MTGLLASSVLVPFATLLAALAALAAPPSAVPVAPAADGETAPTGPGPVSDAEIVFTGRLLPATLPSFCQEESHYVACTGPQPGQEFGSVLVKSSTIDLAPYAGKTYRYTAVAAGVECLIYDVTQVEPPTAWLTVCGTPAVGCTLRVRVEPSGVLGVFGLYGGGTPDFAPVDTSFGTALIGPPFFLLGAGPTAGPGSAVDLAVPGDPSFVGIDLWVQGVRADVGPVGPPEATDARCFTILPGTVTCVQPDC